MTEPRIAALVARLEKGGRKTVEVLGGLRAEQWQSIIYPDPCWSVRDLLAHFVAAEERLLELAQDVAAGGPGAPLGFDFDAFNAEQKERLAGQSPDALLASLADARERTLAWVGSLAEAQLDLVGRHPALGEVSLETQITAIYGHQLLHMRDLAERLRGD